MDSYTTCVESTCALYRFDGLKSRKSRLLSSALAALLLYSSWRSSKTDGKKSVLAESVQSADVHVDVPSEELSEKRAALLKKAAAQKPSQDSWGLDTIKKTEFSKATPKDKAVVAEQEKRERKRQNRRQRAREKAQHRERQKQEASSSRGGVEPNISVQSLEGGIGDVCLRFDNLTLDFGSATSLLDGASLRLLNAGKYGVVGKNGCGKSTLLNQLYNISLENQDNLGGIRVLYVAQEAEGTSKSAVQTVVDADTERTSLLKRESGADCRTRKQQNGRFHARRSKTCSGNAKANWG